MSTIWDRFGGTMKWTYREPDLTGEGVLGSWPATAAELQGSGRLLLTDKALAFCPADLRQTQKLLDLILSATQIPGADTISKLAKLSSDTVLVIPLANISSAEQVSRSSLFKPPTVRIATKPGSTYDFGVLAGVGYPNISKTNNNAVSDLLGKLQPLVERS